MKTFVFAALITHIGLFVVIGEDQNKPLYSLHANKKLLRGVMVPRLDLKDVSLEDALVFLTYKLEDFLIQTEELSLTFELTAAPDVRDRSITLVVENQSMWECLLLISENFKVSLSVTERGVSLYSKE